jgi:predicted PurR-regulated permease PerM
MERISTVTISTTAIVKTILLVLLVWLLFFLKDLVLIVLTSIVIASAIEPSVRWFLARGLARVFSVLLIYILAGLTLASVFYVFAPLFLEEVSSLLASLPNYLNSFDVSKVPFGASSLLEQLSFSEVLQSLQLSLSSMSLGFVETASIVFGGLTSFILVVVFSFYFAVQETGVDDFLRIVTPQKYQKRVLSLWKRSQMKIGLWMKGQLTLAFIVGVLVYLGLTVLGVSYALVLAIIAAFFELIPLFGPVLAAVPAAGLALSDGGFGLMLMVIGLFIIIQQFENHLLYPLVVTKVVGIPPLLVILALLIGAQVAGLLGIILSVPAAVVLQELLHEIDEERAGVLAGGQG